MATKIHHDLYALSGKKQILFNELNDDIAA